MNEEVKELLDRLNNIPMGELCAYCLEDNECKIIVECITNLEKEIERLKNREKELKYFNDILENKEIELLKENKRLKVNYKNDRSHQVNFDYFQLLYNNYSKDIIIDDLVYKCEDLDNCKKGYGEAVIKYGDYKSRCEKAIPMLKELNIKLKDILKIGIDIKEISDIENVLNGGDKE